MSPSQDLDSQAMAVRCRWMFSPGRAPRPGLLTLAGGRVVACGENLSGRPPLDLGAVGLLPGLVNAHCHLEFSDLAEPIGRAGAPLPEWIGQVVARRRSAEDYESLRQRAIAAGAEESRRCGVWHVGDIVTSDAPGPHQGLDRTCFRELLSFDAAAAQPLAGGADQLADADGLRWAFSPHAPYSTHLEVLAAAARCSHIRRRPLAMHLAESPEELELLKTWSGPFRDVLERLGAWRDGVLPEERTIMPYLRRLAEAHHGLLIHGNYLHDNELDWLAGQGGRVTVVYCPRTHAYFGHPPHPLPELLSRGVPVALGTDSRASNPDLSIWEEARHCWSNGLAAADELLRMVTSAPAAALGIPVGRSLETGAPAQLTVIPLDVGAAGPWEQLFQGGSPQRLEIDGVRGGDEQP